MDVKLVILLGAVLDCPVFDGSLRRRDRRRIIGSNGVGVAPSTVMKKFVGLAGLLGSESTSEKIESSFRRQRRGGRGPRRAGDMPGCQGEGITGSGGGDAVVAMLASGRVGSFGPIRAGVDVQRQRSSRF